jgi:hypothetical protein
MRHAVVEHPTGHYQFLPGIAPYSCGVVASPGFEIAHVTLHTPVPYARGFQLIEQHLAAEGHDRTALCAIELRSPRPFTFEGFASFNGEYARILESWGVFVDGVNPVARTNVCPEVRPPSEPILYGFSYTRTFPATHRPSFIVAGAGELPEGVLAPQSIVRAGETNAAAIAAKAAFVLDLMETRLHGLGGDWSMVTAVDVYTVHPIWHLLPDLLANRLGRAATHGLRWFYSRPPIEGIEFEMDLRGVASELRLE